MIPGNATSEEIVGKTCISWVFSPILFLSIGYWKSKCVFEVE